MGDIKRKRHRFHALMSRCGIMEQKKNILAGQGVESTLDLTECQLDGLNAWLDSLLNWGNLKDYQFATFDNNNRQHRYLLSLCQEYGWTAYNEKINRTVADLNRLGRWIRYNSKCKKPMQQQSTKELETTIYQFEQMVKKHFSNNQ
jgi:hypothetical protein